MEKNDRIIKEKEPCLVRSELQEKEEPTYVKDARDMAQCIMAYDVEVRREMILYIKDIVKNDLQEQIKIRQDKLDNTVELEKGEIERYYKVYESL